MKENKLDYTPEPMDLSSVDLPESLIQLSERIAENVHEVWAKARMDEGWTYGGKRDDIHKKHPCLVPYDELPEEEKEYDRNTAYSHFADCSILSGSTLGKQASDGSFRRDDCAGCRLCGEPFFPEDPVECIQ